LKRLTSANNPESGTISYQYDNNGNLLVRTDARPVSAHFEYDVLNRMTRRWYNGSSSTSATTHNSPSLPAGVGASNESKLFYDAQTLPGGAPSFSRGSSTGRLVAQTYGTGSNGDYFAYDSLGRQTLKVQQTGTVNYQMSAAYNLSGAVTSMTYPSGRTISNSFDNAGRLTTFSGNLGDGTTRTYANEIIYSSLGSMAKEKFGTTTPVYNKLFYNVRGQLAEIRVSTSYTGPTDTNWNRGAIINHYSDQCWGMCSGSNMTDNNGNLRKQDVYIPHDDQISSSTQRWQQYDYDPLNRLKWVREILSGAEQWKQQFTYDRWGNRTIDTGVTYGIGINNKAFTVNAANNRLGVPGGQSGVMSYDAAGNLTNDTYTGAGNRTYDAENKITSAWGGANQAQLYSYDASGQRIKRIVNGVETWQVYGFGSELLAEYPASGAATTPQKENGYRNGQLLVTADSATGGSAQNVSWTNGVGVSISGNSLTRTLAGDGWNAGARSSQSIASGDGYVEFTASETNKKRTMGLTDNTSVTGYQHIDYGILLGETGQITIHEGVAVYGVFGTYTTGDTLRVAVEGGVVKYRKNGALLRTSTLAPAYPLYAGAALFTNGSTITNAVLSSGGSSSVQFRWLVADHLGTPRMIIDQTGSLANVKRHDYLPFGEELFAPVSGRSAAQGYSGGDGVRQQFTQKERDVETGLDYFGERYYASAMGRFTTVDPLMASATTHDPQSFNRYTFVLNNPLRYVDPDGLKAKTPWDLLTAKERKIITPKLTVPKGQTAKQVFNVLATVKDAKGRVDRQATADKVTTIKNFIDSAGGHTNSEVWQQIKTINSIDTQPNPSDPSKTEGRVTVSVGNKDQFLAALGRSGYDVDRYYELASDHPNNSARQITNTSFEPGLHFANDDSSNLNKFYAHWDRRSSAFRKGSNKYWTTWGEQIDAGSTHNNPYSPSQLRQELKKNGTVPRGEP
jgi:RHS repeat-associated protein